MESVQVKDAIGMVLCHDITKIVPGGFKGCVFKKGHIIKEEDVRTLLDIGKENIYVWNLNSGFVHEDDAAVRMTRMAAGRCIKFSEPKEGKVDLIAKYNIKFPQIT